MFATVCLSWQDIVLKLQWRKMGATDIGLLCDQMYGVVADCVPQQGVCFILALPSEVFIAHSRKFHNCLSEVLLGFF